MKKDPTLEYFDNVDDGDQSTIKILNNAPRGETGRIDYNDQSVSVLSGFSTASVSFDEPILTIGGGSTSLRAGTEFPIILGDDDQNTNSGSRDHLDVFRDTAIIPTLELGSPVTLEDSSNVKFYTNSGDTFGKDVSSSVPDKTSDRLIIDTPNAANGQFEKISFNLGITASNLQSVLIDSSNSNTFGTNWLNYDLRSFSNDLEINDFSDTTVELFFGSLNDNSPITIVDAGQMSSSGLIQIE